MAGRDDLLSLEAMEDLETMAEILGAVMQKRRPDLLDDDETRWRLERAVERSKEREQTQGRRFTRWQVNARQRQGEHLELMHQQHQSGTATQGIGMVEEAQFLLHREPGDTPAPLGRGRAGRHAVWRL
jgi:hypothetical protein